MTSGYLSDSLKSVVPGNTAKKFHLGSCVRNTAVNDAHAIAIDNPCDTSQPTVATNDINQILKSTRDNGHNICKSKNFQNTDLSKMITMADKTHIGKCSNHFPK